MSGEEVPVAAPRAAHPGTAVRTRPPRGGGGRGGRRGGRPRLGGGRRPLPAPRGTAARLGAAARASLGQDLTPAALGAILDDTYQTPSTRPDPEQRPVLEVA